MHVDNDALFGGGLSWANINTAGLAKKSQVDKSTLSRMLAGQEGLSVAAARKVAETMEMSPVVIYVGTQALAAKNASESGETDMSQALRGIARITDGLKQFTPSERAGGGEVIGKSFEMLWKLVDEPRGVTTPEPGSMSKLGRDPSGLKVVKNHDPERLPEETSTAKKSKRPGRNADGTSNRKINM